MWELIEEKLGDTVRSDRLRVPEGWIVRSYTKKGAYSNNGGIHHVYIRDFNHEWKLKGLEE